MDADDAPPDVDPSQYEHEARERWGDTDAWKESQRRTREYSKDDWERIRRASDAIVQQIAARMDHGIEDPDVQRGVAAYRQHITDTYYTCTVEIFRGLAEMYVADARFAANWESVRPGMAQFMRAAMLAYCDRLQRR